MKQFAWLIILLLTSCINNGQKITSAAALDIELDLSNITTIPIDSLNYISLVIKEEDVVCDPDKLIDYIEYIPLETRANILIGNINKLFIHNDMIYILDASQAMSVFIFDITGKHINTIAGLGRGPQEYLRLGNMTIDKINNELILMDDLLHTLLFYDLEGNFQKKQNMGMRISELVRIDNDNFLLRSGRNWNDHIGPSSYFRVTIGDPFKEIKQHGFKMNSFDKQIFISGYSHFRPYKDGILFSASFTNEIYNISTDGKANLKYRFIFPNGSPEMYAAMGIDPDNTDNFTNEIVRKRMWWFLGSNYIETDRFLFAGLTRGNAMVNLVYDKIDNESLVFYTKNLTETGKAFANLPPLCDYEGYLYSTISAFDVLNCKSETQKKYSNPDWKLPDKLLNIKEEDNPVIVKYTIKTPIRDAYVKE